MDSIAITGGHHSSALPVIEELNKRFPNIKIYWYGHKHSLQGSRNVTLEFQEITKLGIPFHDLHAGKFYKTFNPVRLLKIPYGFFQALHLLKKHRPQVILSFGGYLGVPVVLAGWLLGIPVVSHEQTVVIGYANKLISKFAKKVLYTWEESLQYIPKQKAVQTGLPIREAVTNPRNLKFVCKNNLPTILVMAGKTGSHIINTAILGLLEDLLQMVNVIHQTGDHSRFKDYEKLCAKYEQIKTKVPGLYYPEKFIYSEDIGDAYHQADLVMARSGAHTCLEIIALEKPCILIPIPWSSHNEQYKNAEAVKEAGLAEIVDQDRLVDQEYLLEVVKEMLVGKDRYVCKESFAQVANSATLIVNEVEKIAKKNI